jgi:hypothetical protein
LFTIKENLVIMNNLYHKISVASVCTALIFTLGANKEAKAATLNLTPVTSFGVTDQNRDRQGDSYYSGVPFHVGLRNNSAGQWQEDKAFYEFNIANLSPASTIISKAIFRVRVNSLNAYHRYNEIELFGYIGNGQPDVSDFPRGIGARYSYGATPTPLSYLNLETSVLLGRATEIGPFPVQKFNFNIDFTVTPFVNELIRRNNAFAGFSVSENDWHFGDATLDQNASLIIETEPVPEPTTIFGSALALVVGGWLKRKKSS